MSNQPSRPAAAIPRGRQREIAEHAGVSISTVSRVLNNVAGISDDLQQRVRAAASALGYTLGGPPQGPLRRIVLVGGNSSYSPAAETFYTGIITGADAECRAQGIELRYIYQPGISSASILLNSVCLDDGAGVLLMATDERALVERVLASDWPVALINAEHPDLPIDTFLPDNWFASYRAVRYLIARGHRQILHVSISDRTTIQRRHRAYRAALEDAGLVYDPALVITPPASIYAAIRELLDQPPQFTAVFCSSDSAAIETMSALQDAGIRVPDDVAVVGFDDIPLAALVTPPLTTMRVECAELGALAVRRLVERAANPQLPAIRVELFCPLVERQSVAPYIGARDEIFSQQA